MTTTYTFDKAHTQGHYEVRIDTAAAYGYFEHDELGDESGGGLWFTRLGDGCLSLTEYDGVAVLPEAVCHALRAQGVRVDLEFWPDDVVPPLPGAPAYVKHFNRIFKVLATFPALDNDHANAYMVSHPGASMLLVADGVAYLADKDDKGKPMGRKLCCICGAFAGKWAQHWNRDTGFGTCRPCVDRELSRVGAPEVAELYGKEGLNYAAAGHEGFAG